MRISIVTGFFLPVPPLRGGSSEKIWHRLAREFAAAGHEVTMLSRAWPGLPLEERSEGVRHLRLPGADHSSLLAANLWQDLRWGRRVARALPAGDVVICNTVSLPIWLRRFKPSAGRVVAVVARMPKGRGRVYGGVDLILALGEPVARSLREENPRLSGRIAPFPYPIDWQLHARAGKSRSAGAGPVTIGYVGRLHPEKGLPLLLAAAELMAARRDLPSWQLSLVGPADVASGGGGEAWWRALRERHAAALQGRLNWSGAEFEPAALAGRYGAMDIFCYPSVAEAGETFGVAVAEAMAAGCAPVVSALDCFAPLVRDGETGLIFDHRGAGADLRLAEALGGLAADPPRRAALAERARERARDFDFGPAAEELLRRLATLAEMRSNPP